MKRILLSVSGIVVVVIGIFCVVVALQPSEFQIQRTKTVQATPAAIFPHVNNLQAWDAWSPWAKVDPEATATFSGPPAGQGANMEWSGNDEVGAGTMTILTSEPDQQVVIEQAFVRPMEGTAQITFSFVPRGDATDVTWTMNGTNNFLGRAICLLMDMDSCVGDKMEEGLSNLQKVAEGE